MPFLPIISLITDHAPLALRARVLIRRNPISSQSDQPKPPKAEGLISLHQGACVWLGNRTTTTSLSLSGPLRHDLSVLTPVGRVSPRSRVCGSSEKSGGGKQRPGEQASKLSWRTHAPRNRLGWQRENSSSVSTQSHGNGEKSLAGLWLLLLLLPAVGNVRIHPFCFVPSGYGPMSCPSFFSLPHTTWR